MQYYKNNSTLYYKNMYFIKKIAFDSEKKYQNSSIVNHTNKTISTALKLLESSVRQHIYEECGREASDKAVIMDIAKIENIIEPMNDGIMLYRFESDMFRIFVYQKKTIFAKGWIGTKITSTFFLTHMFELEEYKNFIETSNISIITSQLKSDVPPPPGEMVTIGNSNVKIPKAMISKPTIDLINELKKSSKFKKRQEISLTDLSSETIKPKIPPIENIEAISPLIENTEPIIPLIENIEPIIPPIKIIQIDNSTN